MRSAQASLILLTLREARIAISRRKFPLPCYAGYRDNGHLFLAASEQLHAFTVLLINIAGWQTTEERIAGLKRRFIVVPVPQTRFQEPPRRQSRRRRVNVPRSRRGRPPR